MESETIKKALDNAILSNNQKEVTNLRGRLIKEYRKEIDTLLKDQDITEEEKQRLISLKEQLQEEIEKHKIQLSARYNNEFINKKTKFGNFVSVLPNAVSIAVEKVKTCIEERKAAKQNKDKTVSVMETLKSVGVLAATPFVYLGKFVLDQWYAVAGVGGAIYLWKHPDKIIPLGKKALEVLGLSSKEPDIVEKAKEAVSVLR